MASFSYELTIQHAKPSYSISFQLFFWCPSFPCRLYPFYSHVLYTQYNFYIIFSWAPCRIYHSCSFNLISSFSYCLLQLGIHSEVSKSQWRVHFTYDFSIANQIWRNIYFAVIPLLVIWSLQKFAHNTTKMLSCHVQTFIEITWLELGWQQD